jgi:SAM-dependent MidA family methyltransferase
MEEENRDLRQFILSHIKETGPIPFSQFMAWCLYHPVHGYYSSEGAKIGGEGDYYSSPSVHPLFGRLVAKQLAQMADILGRGAFDVVEMGGGRGFLCKDILDWLKSYNRACYGRLRYTLMEKSPYFVEEQKGRLSFYEKEGKVFWTDPETFEGQKTLIEGCYLSNELIDSFPVHRVTVHHGVLKEIYVTQENDQFAECLQDLSDPRISDYFRRMGVVLEEGQRAEVNLEALHWIERVACRLTRGFVITIDYGYLAEELYAPRRREGTLLCYFRHRVSENPYERLGKQDMTSHVNFTALIQKGEEVGLRCAGLVPQYRFLLALGLLQETESMGKVLSTLNGLKLRLSLKHLIESESGMGEIFKVLIQHKGVDQPQLMGLRDLDTVPWPA